MGCCDADMNATLELLKCRYRNLIAELAEIRSTHPLNMPEVKTVDGGTTIENAKKIKQLEDSILAARKAIKDHMDLCAELEGGSVVPWTLETTLEL